MIMIRTNNSYVNMRERVLIDIEMIILHIIVISLQLHFIIISLMYWERFQKRTKSWNYSYCVYYSIHPISLCSFLTATKYAQLLFSTGFFSSGEVVVCSHGFFYDLACDPYLHTDSVSSSVYSLCVE